MSAEDDDDQHHVEELQGIPSARDPWVVMQTRRPLSTWTASTSAAPNRASSRTTTPRARRRPTTPGTSTACRSPTWAATGASASALLRLRQCSRKWPSRPAARTRRNATGGVQLNMVLKRGPTPRTAARGIYFENEDLQSKNIAPELAAASAVPPARATACDRYKDYGFEIGGPIVRDRFWDLGRDGAGRHRPAHADRRPRRTSFRDKCAKAGRKADARHPRQLHVLPQQQDRRIGRERRRDAPAGNAPGTRRARPTITRAKATSSSATLLRVGEGAQRERRLHAGARGRPRPGLLLSTTAGSPTIRTVSPRPAGRSDYVGGDGKLLRRRARAEVRRFAGAATVGHHTRQNWPASHLIATWHGYPNMLVQVARDYRRDERRGLYRAATSPTPISIDRLTVDRRRPLRSASSRHWARRRCPASLAFENAPPGLECASGRRALSSGTLTPRVGVTYALDRIAQDDRARELRDVRVAAARVERGVRVADPVLLRVTTTPSTRTATGSPR